MRSFLTGIGFLLIVFGLAVPAAPDSFERAASGALPDERAQGAVFEPNPPGLTLGPSKGRSVLDWGHSFLPHWGSLAPAKAGQRRVLHLQPTWLVPGGPLWKSDSFFSALSEIDALLQLAGAGYHFMGPENINGWSEGSYAHIREALHSKPEWDTDNFFLNYVGHPYAGSCFYLMGRNRGLGIFGSWLVSTCGSVLWEYVYEGLYETPSANDLITTSNVGFLIGEISWQAKKVLVKSDRTREALWKKALIFVVDPWDLISRTLHFGPLWAADRFQMNPFCLRARPSYLPQRWED
ncbi:MAG: DUF3943 domain-containing protein [bacterium]